MKERGKNMKPVFNVGFDGNKKELEQLLEVSKHIGSVYVHIGDLVDMIAGDRSQYCNILNEIHALVETATKKNVALQITLDSPCGIESTTNNLYWEKIRTYLKDLEKIGVDGIIASHPFIMTEIKESTNMQLTASAICDIHSCRSAVNFENIGADFIVPSINCNYNFELLHEMKHALKKAKLQIMVNEHCLGDCLWRRYHQNHNAHSKDSYDYHSKCKNHYGKKPHSLLTNTVIRPEDLYHYEEITNEFEIVGRQLPISVLTDVIKAYDVEKYDGNYVSLFDITLAKEFYLDNQSLEELFNNKSKCSQYCHKCRKCIDMYSMASRAN